MNTIKSINGVALPIQPKSDGGYTVICSDLDSDSTGRSAETGTLLRYVIRKDVYRIELAFRGKGSDIRTIRDMVSKDTLTVEFWDLDRWITKTMYKSDRSEKLLAVPLQNGWYDFSFRLIEY